MLAQAFPTGFFFLMAQRRFFDKYTYPCYNAPDLQEVGILAGPLPASQ